MLIVMCGLPAAGKSAVAEALGRALPAAVVSVDPVEAALWRAGIDREQPTGLAAYAVAHTVAAENLRLEQTVVVDAVNDDAQARAAWVELARQRSAPVRFIEVTCPDEELHRRRLLGRRRRIDGFPEPSWESVQARRPAFEAWEQRRLVLDSREPLEVLTARALEHLRRR